MVVWDEEQVRHTIRKARASYESGETFAALETIGDLEQVEKTPRAESYWKKLVRCLTKELQGD